MDEQPLKKSALRFTKRRIGVFVAGVLLAALIWLLAMNRNSTPMPVYEGKTAQEWMYGDAVEFPESRFYAFHEMGSNAVPFLVRELERKDSVWQRLFRWIYWKVPLDIRVRLPEPANENARWNQAGSLLEAVPHKTAIPELMRLIDEGKAVQKQIAAGLLSGSVKYQDTDCIPELTFYLNSTNQMVSLAALDLLSHIRLGPEVVPNLTNFPCSTSKIVQFQVAKVLNDIDWKIASDYLKARMPEQFSWMTQTNIPKTYEKDVSPKSRH
jgi:hypothetical protein